MNLSYSDGNFAAFKVKVILKNECEDVERKGCITIEPFDKVSSTQKLPQKSFIRLVNVFRYF